MKTFSNFKTLLKFNLKYFLMPRFATKKDKRRYYITMAIIALALLFPLGSMIAGIYFLVLSSQDIEMTKNLLSSLFALSQIATLVFATSTYLQVMYLSKDKEILATLPVTPTEVFLTKIITVTVMEMIISVVLVIPSTLVSAIALAQVGVHLTAWYYVLIPIAALTLPLLVVLLVSVFSFPIMKLYSYVKKHQTIGAIIIVLLIVGLVMAIYIPLYSNMGSNTPSTSTGEEGVPVDDSIPIDDEASSEVPDDLVMPNGTLNGLATVGKYAFHTKALVNAMFNEQVAKNLLIYFAITLGTLALGVFLSSLLYRSIISSLDDNIATTKKGNQEFVESSVKKALLKREISCLTKDMNKLINILMSYVMGPAIIFVMLFIMNMNAGGAEGDSLRIMDAFSIGFTMGYAVFMIGGSNVGVSAGISLEGKSFAILKTLPVNGIDIFRTKLQVIDIGAIVSAIVSLVIALIMVKSINIIDIIGYLACAPLTICSMNAYSLYRDLRKPKLEWTIVKDITKNNMATLVPLAIALPEGILAIALPIVFAAVIPNRYLASAIAWGILLVGAVIYYFALRRPVFNKVNRMFEEVEC